MFTRRRWGARRAGGRGAAGRRGRSDTPAPGRGERHEVGAGTAEEGVMRAPAKHDARPQGRGDGWRGSRYRRPADGAGRAPAAEGGPFVEDGVDEWRASA